MEIVEISKNNIKDIKGLDEPFEIIGKLKPSFANGEWSYTEELFWLTWMEHLQEE